MNLQDLGNRIRKQREKFNLKQVDIANALQISSQAVSKWERGENAPDIAILLKLCNLLSVTTDWLLGGTMGSNDTFEATVLCSSIKGFAKKSRILPPKDIASWANGIFYMITESALRYDGVPVKYVGDGFLSFFTGPFHADRAFKSAIHCKHISNNNDLIISLHTGNIYLGSIGHPDYSISDIIGETVNTAFLTLPWISKNCTGGVGLSQTTFQNMKEQYSLSKYMPEEINGLQANTVIYEANPENLQIN